ncbi:hypothetical protein Ait01nite_078900 [Actinoplanes italicus]|nr:hypothetical protein Ait01nite_078900 [Actinoplanes italicus]
MTTSAHTAATTATIMNPIPRDRGGLLLSTGGTGTGGGSSGTSSTTVAGCLRQATAAAAAIPATPTAVAATSGNHRGRENLGGSVTGHRIGNRMPT